MLHQEICQQMWRVMLRNKYLLLLLLLLVIFIPTNNVNAATTADVVITASGYIVGSPSGLVISYTGEDWVDISWVKGLGANNTMVRVGHNSYPTSLTDGDLVYYGNGTACTYVIDYERLLENNNYEGLYFNSWSQGAGGVWQLVSVSSGASLFWRDVILMFLIVVLIVLSLTFFAFRLKNVALSIMAAFGFAGIAVHQLNLYYTYASVTGLEPLIGYTCVAMSILMFFAPLMFIKKTKLVVAKTSGYSDLLNDSDINELIRARKEIRGHRR